MEPEIEAFLKDLHITPGDDHLLESEPPVPVSMDLLRHYYRGLLDEDESESVTLLITRYRQWADASGQVVIEEGKRAGTEKR